MLARRADVLGRVIPTERGACVADFLTAAYPWIKSLHIVAMVAWMAGLFYLPRLFVYHAERRGGPGRAVGDVQGDGAQAAPADHERRR